MRTYDRSGVHIEQCESCRGIFLDYGELEALAQFEARYQQPAPPPPAYGGGHQPAWGAPHRGHHKQGGFMRQLFSS
jgi:Zn-finger nucleic acid-binding protein